MKGTYLEINENNTAIDDASLSIVNNSPFNPREPHATSGLLSLEVSDDVDGAAFIETLFRRSVIDEVVLTEITTDFPSSGSDQGFFGLQVARTFKNVRVESVSTSIREGERPGESRYFVSLRYEQVDTLDKRLDSKNVAIQTVESTNNFSDTDFKSLDEVSFGGTTLRPTSGVLEGPPSVLKTPSGDIEVIEFGYDSFRLPGTSNSPGGNQVSDFHFSSPQGLHSSGLVAAAASGERVEKLTFSKTTLAGGGPVEFQQVELENVSIGSYRTSPSESGEVIEDFTVVVHGKVTFTTTPVLENAETGTPVTTVFNVETGQAEGAPIGFPNTGTTHNNSGLVLKIGSMELPIDGFDWGTMEVASGEMNAPRPLDQQSQSINVSFDFDETGATSLLSQSLASDDRGPLIEKIEIIQRESVNDDALASFVLTGIGVNVDSFDFQSDDEGPGTVRASFSLEQVILQVRDFDPPSNDSGEQVPTQGNQATWDFESQTTEVLGVLNPFAMGRETTYPISKADLDERLAGLSSGSVGTSLLLEIKEDGDRKGGIEMIDFSFETRQLIAGESGSASITTHLGLGDIRLLERLAFGKSGNDDFLIRSFNGAGMHQWNLENVRVTSYQVGSQGRGTLPTVTIDVAFDEATFTQQSRDIDGTLEGTRETRIDYLRPAVVGSTQFGIRSVGQPQTGLFLDLGSEFLPLEQTQWAVSASGTEIDQDQFVFSTRQLSPGLQFLAADGRAIPEITLRKTLAIGSGANIEAFEEVVWILENARVSSYTTAVGADVGDVGQRAEFALSFDSVRLTQSIIEPVDSDDSEGSDDSDDSDPPNESDGFRVIQLPQFAFDFVDDQGIRDVPFMNTVAVPSDTGTIMIDVRGFVDEDDDRVGQAIEDAAPNNGDGNDDGTLDSTQDNVTSLPHPIAGNFVTLVAPEGQRLTNVSIVADPAPETSPPADLDFRVGLADYQLTNVPVGEATTVTILVDGVSGFNTFYKFGPTPRNPTPHYYRFLFDGRTGAQFDGDRIIIHLVDGERGDDDLTANGVILDPGAPVINNSEFPHHNPVNRFDVNSDGLLTAVDALVVINRLNAVGGGAALPVPIPDINDATPFFDVNPDNNVLPTDALQVINELIRTGGSGEPIVETNIESLESSTGIIDVTTRAVAQTVGTAHTFVDERMSQQPESGLISNHLRQFVAISESSDDETSNFPAFSSEPTGIPSIPEPSADLIDDYFKELGNDLDRLI